MRKILLEKLLFLPVTLFVLAFSCSQKVETTKGILLIVGGGNKPEAAIKEFVELCENQKILVISSASAVPVESGIETTTLFRDAGATAVDWLFIAGKDTANADSIVKKITSAKGIFFTGGVQSRLMNRIGGTRAAEALQELYHKRRGIIGGTSAGAAVMSEIMITGDGDFGKLAAGNIVNVPGLGFIKDYIIDQHFVVRQRNNRLLSLVIEKRKTGIGIDESTAIVLYPDDTLKVYGKGQVLVYDPRDAVQKHAGSQNLAMEGIKLSVLKEGDIFDLKSGKSIENVYP